jgi:hypothetical protein
MEEQAQRLFSDKFEVSPLAQMLDQVADLSPLSQAQNQSKQPDSQSQQSDNTIKHKRHAYPSPDRSPDRSPEPLTPSNIALPTPLPLLTVSHKRRRSSSEAIVDDIDSPNRPQKRLRYVLFP